MARGGPYKPSKQSELRTKIDRLISEPLPDRAAAALEHGEGTWEVIHAPHIARLSGQLGTSFKPIRYKLEGRKIVSNVQYSSSLFKEGWLSASGTVEASGTNTLQVLFDKFWVDFGTRALREELQGRESWSLVDRLVMAVGKLGFLPQFSYFPVQYMDPDGELAVFSFPPLNSSITIRRI